MSDLAAALMVAIRAHAGQVDKLDEPYLLHVLRVAERVRRTSKAVAVLHDVFEDSDLMLPAVARECGLDSREQTALVLLTRLGQETYADYIRGTADSELAREVKLADIEDNLGRIPTPAAHNAAMHERYAHVVSSWPDWADAWGSLKVRYENAIATLESAGKAA